MTLLFTFELLNLVVIKTKQVEAASKTQASRDS